MSIGRLAVTEITGALRTPTGGEVDFIVETILPHRLIISLIDGHSLDLPTESRGLTLQVGRREFKLGRCRLDAAPAGLRGDGQLIFLDDLYDFTSLKTKGVLTDLDARTRQLPLLWKHKRDITPAFREFVSNLVYDLQCLRDIYAEIDQNLASEPRHIREEIQGVVCNKEAYRFANLMDKGLEALAEVSKDFDRSQHEKHGFYLRRQLSDMILGAPILWRTNVRPRGYAGDSTMMRMLYEAAFEGETIFGKLLHQHVTETHAAQAVRNRRQLIPEVISEMRATFATGRSTDEPFRVFSVACGPSWELHDLITQPEDATRYHLTLLDQDPEALEEAEGNLEAVSHRVGRQVPYRLLRDSVRTMLWTPNLAEAWGQFECIYSMGLYDYLTAPVAKAVTRKLYELLHPGGHLVIGNFHTQNPTRAYMEYWMDWVLFYRTEEDFLALTEGLEGATCAITFEETGSQMFLRIQKPEQDHS